jgi:hypothetical protein
VYIGQGQLFAIEIDVHQVVEGAGTRTAAARGGVIFQRGTVKVVEFDVVVPGAAQQHQVVADRSHREDRLRAAHDFELLREIGLI